MSYSSMTLKNVMGGCELMDLKPSTTEKSTLLIDLSVIGVNLHELQKNLVPNNVCHESETEALQSEFRGESFGVQSNDSNNNFSVNHYIEDKAIKSNAQSESTEVECNLELFDLNANKVVQAKPNDLLPPVFTSIQHFYETFDVSDQIEAMSDGRNIGSTPSSVSTLDSSLYDQDQLIICEPSIFYPNNLEIASTTASTTAEDQCGLYFIPSAVISQDPPYQLIAPKIANRSVQSDDKSNARLEPKEKKKKLTGRTSRKKPSPEKNISCSRCSKKFRTAAHLKVHFVIHVDSECVHRCTICERRFCHRGALTLHARRHQQASNVQTEFLDS